MKNWTDPFGCGPLWLRLSYSEYQEISPIRMNPIPSKNPGSTGAKSEAPAHGAACRQRFIRLHQWADWLCNRSIFRTGGRIDRALAFTLKKLFGERWGGHPSLVRWFWRKIATPLLPKPEKAFACPTRLGFDLHLNPRGNGNYLRFGFYEAATLAVMQALLRPGNTFVDIGASVGQMSFYAAKLVGPTGKVLAFEPEPSRFEQLTQSLRINPWANMEAKSVALGSQPGQAELFVGKHSPSLKQSGGSSRSVQVEIDSLDNLLTAYEWPIDMIKLDVEGFEWEVIQGARTLLQSESPPVICFEYGVYETGSNLLRELQTINPRYRFVYSRFGNADAYPQMIPANPSDKIPTSLNLYAVPKDRMEELNSGLSFPAQPDEPQKTTHA